MKDKITFHKILGMVFIIFGIIMYPTPIPGTSILILLGFVWFMGKRKTISYLRHILSRKAFAFLHVKEIVKNID